MRDWGTYAHNATAFCGRTRRDQHRDHLCRPGYHLV